MSLPVTTVVDPARPTGDEMRADGRAHRSEHPRRSLATLTRGERPAVEILVEQNQTRLADLVPLRFARMLTDPFAFYRGSAAVMAADLAGSPSSGIQVVSCGDAHDANFGLYAAPDRSLMFDLNDFDEAAGAPWEWDVKRLTTSAVLGCRQAGRSRADTEQIARATVRAYISGIRGMLELDALGRLYRRGHPEEIGATFSAELTDVMTKAARSASRRTSERVFRKIVETAPGGSLRIRENPPILVHPRASIEEDAAEIFERYAATTSPDIRLVLQQFRRVDLVRRVVGVGSVGTRCFLLLLVGPGNEPLVLQLKEAGQTVLEQYGRVEQHALVRDGVRAHGNGARVTALQRMLQSASDPFLGHVQVAGHDYYVRQFQDMKGSVDTQGLSRHTFAEYLRMCALVLARAHAQSRNVFRLDGYLGSGDAVTEAITSFALAYADVAVADWESLRAAADAGAIEVAPDPLR